MNEGTRTVPGRVRPGWPVKTWLILALLTIPVLAGGAYMAIGAERQTKVDPTILQLAKENSGGAVDAFTGPKHTVYHSLSALPSEASPRADGKPVLVWFTNTHCSRCEDMNFAQQVAATFRERMVFVEKATDRDTSAAVLGVRDLPTFVLLDARGQEVGRFGFQPDAAALKSAIENALVGISRP